MRHEDCSLISVTSEAPAFRAICHWFKPNIEATAIAWTSWIRCWTIMRTCGHLRLRGIQLRQPYREKVRLSEGSIWPWSFISCRSITWNCRRCILPTNTLVWNTSAQYERKGSALETYVRSTMTDINGRVRSTVSSCEVLIINWAMLWAHLSWLV